MFKYHEESDRFLKRKKTPKNIINNHNNKKKTNPNQSYHQQPKNPAAQIFENTCVRLSVTKCPVNGLGSAFITKLLFLLI